MKSQGRQENQQMVVRRVQGYLHPLSERLIDWFHINMRMTILQRQTKLSRTKGPETGTDVSKNALDSVTQLLWHDNTEGPGRSGRLDYGVGLDTSPGLSKLAT